MQPDFLRSKRFIVHIRRCLQCHAGQMKDLATTGLGMVMFGDVNYNAKNILGVTVGMAGAMLYSFLSYWERNNVRSQWRISWHEAYGLLWSMAETHDIHCCDMVRVSTWRSQTTTAYHYIEVLAIKLYSLYRLISLGVLICQTALCIDKFQVKFAAQ